MALTTRTASRRRITVLVVASVTLVMFGLRDVPLVRDLRDGAAAVLDPVEGAIATVTSPFGNAWHGLTDYEDVKRENARLEAELAEVDAAAIRTSDAEHQLNDLSAALSLPFVGDVPAVTARVLSGPRSNFSHAVEIDKGTDHGLVVGMPVVTGGGLVGRVVQASGGTAQVELITDPEFRVGVRLATTGELGTAEGRGRGEQLSVDSSISPSVDVPRGTGLVTSGVERSTFPPGIPVGTVDSTSEGSGGLALELIVDPLVDVEQLSYVSVLLWQPG